MHRMGCCGSGMDSGPVNKLVFQTPSFSSYGIWSFKEDLIWAPLDYYGDGYDCGGGTASKGGAEEQNDGYAVPCRLFKCPGARHLVLYCHRNAEDLGTCKRFCEALRDTLKVHVLVPEYPGYGICTEEEPTPWRATRHAFAALDFLRRGLRWPLDQTIVFGYCVGAGPSMMLAAQEAALEGLVLVSPYISLRELFRSHVGVLSHLISEQLPIEECVPRIGCRTLIFHGKQDRMVPVSHSERICKGLNVEYNLVSPSQSGHNSSLIQDETIFLQPMREFFDLPGEPFAELVVPPWAFQKHH